MTLRGSVDRSDYEDARLASGSILSQKDRNQTQYGLRLRAAYELTPGIKPFIQGEIDTRRFDEKIDSSGYERFLPSASRAASAPPSRSAGS